EEPSTPQQIQHAHSLNGCCPSRTDPDHSRPDEATGTQASQSSRSGRTSPMQPDTGPDAGKRHAPSGATCHQRTDESWGRVDTPAEPHPHTGTTLPLQERPCAAPGVPGDATAPTGTRGCRYPE